MSGSNADWMEFDPCDNACPATGPCRGNMSRGPSNPAVPSTNTQNFSLRMMLKMYVLDHKKARVSGEYWVAADAQPNPPHMLYVPGQPRVADIARGDTPPRKEQADANSGTAGQPGTFSTAPFKPADYQERIIGVAQGRRQVMEHKQPGATQPFGGALLKPDDVTYRKTPYDTERQFVSYVVCQNDTLFQSEASKDRPGDPNWVPRQHDDFRFRTNRIVIHWEGRILKYAIDGEVFEVAP